MRHADVLPRHRTSPPPYPSPILQVPSIFFSLHASPSSLSLLYPLLSLSVHTIRLILSLHRLLEVVVHGDRAQAPKPRRVGVAPHPPPSLTPPRSCPTTALSSSEAPAAALGGCATAAGRRGWWSPAARAVLDVDGAAGAALTAVGAMTCRRRRCWLNWIHYTVDTGFIFS
ncbi:uncharacterized protein LOC109704438 isoform X2 [Ananas comosus]|uniref:Uncharacterized protein LOC109704438 isoform X2 n=1 Tax=Ananas comosus TaxID=4615 RepID=A0A6P5EBN6_ANACO|nr:uncharacterized protein LOC109704438 isoform X2 [Ananas comosus]